MWNWRKYKMFELSFLDNPGIAWLMRLLITFILCAIIINRIKAAAKDWAENKSLWGIVDEILQTLLMIVAIVIVFVFPLSAIVEPIINIWWFLYDNVIAHILRFLGFPV